MFKRYAVLAFVYLSGAAAIALFFYTGAGCTLSSSFIAKPSGSIDMHQVGCNVTRTECDGWQEDQASVIDHVNCVGNHIVSRNFQATACFDASASIGGNAQTACNRYCGDLWALKNASNSTTIKCTSTPTSAGFVSPGGQCAGFTGTSNGASMRAFCTRIGRRCTTTAATQQGELFCTALPLQSPDEVADGCFDPTRTDAETFCRNNWTWKDGTSMQFYGLNVTGVQANASLCTTSTTTGQLISYGISSGSFGSLQTAAQNSPLNTKGGFIGIRQDCDASGESCLKTLTDFRAALQDVTVSGVTIHNPEAHLVTPVQLAVQGGQFVVPANSMPLEVVGDVTGVGRGRVVISPPGPMIVATTATTATISGGNIKGSPIVVDPAGILPINFGVSVSGSTTSPNALCVGQTSLQSLFGFESLQDWSSSDVTLALDAARHTQGCFGIDVGGNGFRTIRSGMFTTPIPGSTQTLKLDVFVPANPPNPSWLGAVQMYATCPSANTFNAYIGQVELTGKPLGQFSTLTFPLPASIVSLFSGVHPDCFFSIAVNANQTPVPPVLDNLRFE